MASLMRNNNLLILSVVLLVNGCTVSQSREEPKQELAVSKRQKAEIREAARDEIPFVYDSGDFARIHVQRIPKRIAQEGVEGFPVEAPEHFRYLLEDKRPLPAFEKGGRYFFPAYSSLWIIPLSDHSVADFAKAYPYVNEAAVRLRELLNERPSTFDSNADIHDLPYNNAGGAIQSRVEYLDFNNGRGVLFLTQYSQDYLPNAANNEELTYNFQGLTDNGKYYVAARLALSHPSLPRGIDFTEHIERDENWRYLKRDEQRLHAFTEESFQPSLKTLKLLISSISVE
jgi:hypothetical protein